MKRKITSRLAALAGATLALTLAGAGVASAADSGNIPGDATGSLTIHKYAGEVWPDSKNDGSEQTAPSGAEALADVEFTLYRVDGLDVRNAADWIKINELNAKVAAGDTTLTCSGSPVSCTLSFASPATTYNLIEIGAESTDSDGIAEWPTLDAGAYYVEETDAPVEVAEHVAPFIVTVPMPGKDNTWNYDVHVYPKNATLDIEKDSSDPSGLGVGSTIPWTVTTTVPVVQNGFEDYRLFDPLDPRLELVTDSVAIAIDGDPFVKCTGTNVPTGCDYTVTYAYSSVSSVANMVTVTFTDAGLENLNDYRKGELVWTFDTTLLTIGTGAIENEAIVLVNDPTGTYEDGKGTPTPSVTKWGGLKINKHADNTDKNPLSGAVFQVFDTQAKADACVTLVSDASGSLPAGCADAVSVSRDAAGDPINPAQDKFTTAADGTVTIPGLYIGKDTATSKTYYVVEIVPPAGYVNANAVYDVVVTPGTIANAVTEDVPNAQVPPTTLPMTGAQVSAFLAIAAVLLGGGAIALVVSGRRKAVRN